MNHYSQKYDIRAHRDPLSFGDVIDIMLYERTVRDNATTVSVGEPVVFRTMTEMESIVTRPQPTMRIHIDAGQQLMDELWRAGIRPTEGQGSAGAMAAVERHLEDMRTLVFKKKP